jgi:hypothetical protein
MRSSAKESNEAAGGVQGNDARPPAEIWSYIAAALFAGFFLVTSIQIAAHRLLWFDEILTVIISHVDGLSKMLQALAHVDNNMPVLYFLVVHGFNGLVAHAEVAARLPSALAMTAGMLIVFDCARRLADGLHGLIAMSLLACSFLPYFGYEARSYGIYFMLAALAFWVWLHVKGKWQSPVLFAALLFLAIMFHYYAVFCLVPYAAWEASRWQRWRMPSARLISGVLAVCCAAAVLLPQMAGAKRYSAIFWSPPSLFKLRTVFSIIFPDGLLLLALILIWIALTTRVRRNAPAAAAEAGECIGWLNLLIPFAGYVVAKLATNAFVDRYFMGLLPGVAVAFACLVRRHFREARLVSFGILAILAAFGVATQLLTLRHPELIDPYQQQTLTRQTLQMEAAMQSEGKHFILLTDGLLFLPLNYYARHPEQYVLLVPSAEAAESSNTIRYTVGLGRYRPMRFWNLEELKSHIRETALLRPSPQSLRILKDAGIETTVRFTDPMEVDYLR